MSIFEERLRKLERRMKIAKWLMVVCFVAVGFVIFWPLLKAFCCH